MQQFDLIITGGGILGTFHAFHALQKGLKVLLLEKDSYPVGATVRNFGQVVPSGLADKWFNYGLTGLALYKSIQQKGDISVRQNGSVYIASDDDEQLLIHELKTHYDNIGYNALLLPAKEINERYPAIKREYAKEALFFPEEISVEPDKMIHRLHAYMQESFNNFHISYYTPVTAIEETQSQIKVNNQFLANKVIICCGHEGKLLFPDIFTNSGQVVSKLQMLRTIPMPELQLNGNVLTGLTIRRYESFAANCPSFNHVQTPQHYEELKKWGIHILFKQATDNSIIIGDSHEYAPVSQSDDLGFHTNHYINELILEEASHIINIKNKQIATCWSGFYAQHNEKNIFEYDITPQIHIRTGIGGKGMTAGAGYAKESVDLLYGN
ncbi:TIGR03364 family FAD-dependent oxidoreductase [[Flexibacter] sp. ATCC 35208]|uniref:TIGR03364 family FAD-dependent oxidoreductase n=1 Tax=[Flexibacter] sp. ATCC 35208 TaxID=1936242 RepID=UPI0009C789A5|nr:TIGR03364 family FAD-dependent oxidoreductase [[Flexibacter] sp. ATCC 35208]OMP77125.1 oxidase [[Flexibacter] sp. ATCC 35208]